MTKIYIHLGAHKSASTTLQRNLRINSKALYREYGLDYYGSQEIHTSDLGNHFKRLSKSRLEEKDEYDNSILNAKNELKRLIKSSSGGDILMSWEGFLGHSALDLYGGIYTHSDMVADSIKKIFSDYDIRLLLVVRRQDSFIESCYLQQIKETRSLGFQEFTGEIDIKFISWLKVFNSFSSLFPNSVCICPFEYIRSVGAKGFLEYCLSSLLNFNFDASRFEILEQANASFSKEGVEISRDLLPEVSKKHRSELNRILFSEFSSRTGTKAKFFGEFEKKLIVRNESVDNARLFDDFFVKEINGQKFDLDDISSIWKTF